MHWPPRMLPPGESCGICTVCSIKVRKKMVQTDGRETVALCLLLDTAIVKMAMKRK